MLMNLTNVGCLDWDWVQSGVTIGVQNVDTDDESLSREEKKEGKWWRWSWWNSPSYMVWKRRCCCSVAFFIPSKNVYIRLLKEHYMYINKIKGLSASFSSYLCLFGNSILLTNESNVSFIFGTQQIAICLHVPAILRLPFHRNWKKIYLKFWNYAKTCWKCKTWLNNNWLTRYYYMYEENIMWVLKI